VQPSQFISLNFLIKISIKILQLLFFNKNENFRADGSEIHHNYTLSTFNFTLQRKNRAT
jgi:hypothetical protein